MSPSAQDDTGRLIRGQRPSQAMQQAARQRAGRASLARDPDMVDDFPPFHEVAPRLFVGEHPARGGRLSAALDALRGAGICAVVSVCDAGIEPDYLARAGLRGLHLRVDDFGAPEPEQLEQAVAFIEAARRDGGVLVHCFAGIGRSATVACAALIATGVEPADAIAQVRARRHPLCVESAAQQAALLEWGRRFGFR